MKMDLLIIGAGAHAHSVIDVVESQQTHNIVGFLDSIHPRGSDVYGYEVLGTESDLEQILAELHCELFIAVGDNFLRHKIFQETLARVPEVDFATLIHSNAYVSHRASVATGTVIMAGAVVNAGSEIAQGVIVNTNASVDHDGVVNQFASIAPGASLGGSVAIGDRSFIGLGAMLINKVKIGEDVCVGAGAIVIESCEKDAVVLLGSPAKVIKQRAPDAPYL